MFDQRAVSQRMVGKGWFFKGRLEKGTVGQRTVGQAECSSIFVSSSHPFRIYCLLFSCTIRFHITLFVLIGELINWQENLNNLEASQISITEMSNFIVSFLNNRLHKHYTMSPVYKTFGGSKDIWLGGQFNMFPSVSRQFLRLRGAWPTVSWRTVRLTKRPLTNHPWSTVRWSTVLWPNVHIPNKGHLLIFLMKLYEIFWRYVIVWAKFKIVHEPWWL